MQRVILRKNDFKDLKGRFKFLFQLLGQITQFDVIFRQYAQSSSSAFPLM